MSLVHNEQTKLTATAVSNLGLAFGVAGFVAPLVSMSFGLATAPIASFTAVIASVIWLTFSAALHLLARRILRELRP